jgi:peptidoglycan/xylan/chitin deacetylase (PgdA/CDA1 family)/glycosyltransferase involved in cell wall biosynthesis
MPADVAVLMAAYNADATIREAVDSILASSVAVDLFVVDDCSRVPVQELLGSPPGVTFIRLARNGGLAAALNAGLRHILPLNYKYIARMDADDVSYPQRFAAQLAFLERHPEVGMVGGGARFIDDKTGALVMYYAPPRTHAQIRDALYFNNCFVHPTWLMRSDAMARLGPYSLDYAAAEDYEFVRRAASQVVLANVGEYLLDYRISSGGISVSKRRRQLLDRLKIQLKYRDATKWRCWAGIAKTLLLFVIPRKVVSVLKAEWRSWPGYGGDTVNRGVYQTPHQALQGAPLKVTGSGLHIHKTKPMIAKTTILRTGLETLYFSGAHKFMRPFVGGVGAILMLHHVRPPRSDAFQPNRQLEVTPDYLGRVIERLRRMQVDLISLDEMHRRMTERDFGRRFACFTFDDGYRDNKEWAYPVLKAAQVPFALYIATSFPDRLGKLWWLVLEAVIARNPRIALPMDGEERHIDCADVDAKRAVFEQLYWWLRGLRSEAEVLELVRDLAVRYGVDTAALCGEMCMNWREIGEIARDPLATIGAHTVNHVMLAKTSDEAVRAELNRSRIVLDAAIGTAPTHLAYPFGDRTTAGPREFRIAAELGYKTAVTTRPGVLFADHAEHLTALPRISLNGTYQDERFIPVLMSGAATALWNGFRRIDAA